MAGPSGSQSGGSGGSSVDMLDVLIMCGSDFPIQRKDKSPPPNQLNWKQQYNLTYGDRFNLEEL